MICGGADVTIMKSTVNVMCLNHPQTIRKIIPKSPPRAHPPSVEKVSSTKLVLGVKKTGDTALNRDQAELYTFTKKKRPIKQVSRANNTSEALP